MGFERNHTLKIDRGLYLLEQRGGRSYAARAWLDGGWKYTNLNTTDYRAAEQSAVKWHRGLRAGRDGHETIAQAAAAYLDSIPNPGKRTNHTAKWEAIREFWNPGFGRSAITVAEVDTPKLLEFVKWRQARSTLGRSQNHRITAHTLHKDLVTLRQVLKFAVARGVISNVPMFPGAHIVGSIDNNPQPWLTPDEWKHLIAVADERISDASNIRTRQQRNELREWLVFMHATGLRVDEARKLQVRDCTIKIAKPLRWESIPAASLPDEETVQGVYGEIVEYRRKSKTKGQFRVRLPYVEIRVRESKTGPRVCQSRAFADEVFKRLAEGKQATHLLFGEHHRDAFRELLIAGNLRTNHYGHPRNAKCLRPTAISHWLIDKPTIPLSWLAHNCGTSITMLQQFYVKRLGLALDGSAWL